jgi:hypothetical protein
MDSIIKWKLNLDLTKEDAYAIIQELFDGCKKKLNYGDGDKVNVHLVKLYQNFVVKNQSDYVLNFSDKECEKPFISTELFDGYSQTIKVSETTKCPEFTIYVYE